MVFRSLLTKFSIRGGLCVFLSIYKSLVESSLSSSFKGAKPFLR